MAVTLVNTSTNNSGAASSSSWNFTITTPTVGNVLVVCVVTYGGTDVITSLGPGSAIIGQANGVPDSWGGPPGCICIGYVVPTGSPGSFLSFSANQSTYWTAICYEFSGVNTSHPIDQSAIVSDIANFGSSASLTPTQTGDGVCVFGCDTVGSTTLSTSPGSSLTPQDFFNLSTPSSLYGVGGAGVYSGVLPITGSYSSGAAPTGFAFVLLNPSSAGSYFDTIQVAYEVVIGSVLSTAANFDAFQVAYEVVVGSVSTSGTFNVPQVAYEVVCSLTSGSLYLVPQVCYEVVVGGQLACPFTLVDYPFEICVEDNPVNG